MINSTFISHSEEETKHIAADFANQIRGGDIIFLTGNLGSGKTTFVRGVAEARGFFDPVRSPSFTIVNQYPISYREITRILHIDLYRLEDPSDIGALALEEDLGRPDTLAFIEWPEKMRELIVEPSHQIFFRNDGTNHFIQIESMLPLRPHAEFHPPL